MINSTTTTKRKSDLFYSPSTSIAIIWCQFFVGIAIYILSYYLIDDAFSVWDLTTITTENVTKFFFGLLLLPLGWLLWGSAIFRISSVTTYHWLVTIVFLFLLVIALFAIGGIYFTRWGLTDWLQWSATFDGATLVRLIQSVYLILTMWVTAVTIFHILIRSILQRSLYSQEAKVSSSVNKQSAEQRPLISSDQITSQDPIDIQTSMIRKSEDEAVSDKLLEYISVFLFFFVFLPVFIWLNCLTVSDWHRMTPSLIIAKLVSTTIISVDSWNTYFSFSCGTYAADGTLTSYTCYARLFYDVLYWHLFIFVIAMFCYVVNKSPSLRIALKKRIYVGLDCGSMGSLISVTVGECVFWVLWLVMMATIGHYFIVIHLFDEADKIVMEKWARYLGIMAIQFLSMMLFCSSRIRLWNDCFMISFEHLNAYHRFFGVLFILASYIHLVLWIAAWPNIDGNCYPFQVPCTYHADNFTVIFMFWLMIFFVPVVYVVGTFYIIRRRYFEWFYYVHLGGAVVMVSSVLWHSSQSWRYIIPPLVLYCVDRMIRMANSSRICRVRSLEVSLDGNENSNGIEVTKLSFCVGSYSTKFGEAMFEKMQFKMGQYAFINISNISLYEWHPFTIASGENENGESYLQVQNEGAKVSQVGVDGVAKNAQFTNLLYALAQDESVSVDDIEIHVDGPYGAPFVYDGFERIVLVGGGIGITPCHSIFSTLLARSIEFGGKDALGNALPSIDLIWVAKDNKMFSLFTPTWKLFEEHSDESHSFSLRLFATRKNGGNAAVANGNHDENENEKKEDVADSEFNHVVPNTQATMYTYGRPDWSNVLKIIKDEANKPSKTLVFVCGPEPMVVDVEKWAVKYGARFQSESFSF